MNGKALSFADEAVIPAGQRFPERPESLYDRHIASLMVVVEELLKRRGIFHVGLHFSSDQLSCWRYDEPQCYHVYQGEEVFEPSFPETFERSMSVQKPVIPDWDIANILAIFMRLRMRTEGARLEDASLNLGNGLVGMLFSNGTLRFIHYGAFFETVQAV